ncbi:MAG: hypothetical protein AABY22_13310, partial [Nanoarchaeota archaeon]
KKEQQLRKKEKKLSNTRIRAAKKETKVVKKQSEKQKAKDQRILEKTRVAAHNAVRRDEAGKKGWATRRGKNKKQTLDEFLATNTRIKKLKTPESVIKLIETQADINDSDFLTDAITKLSVPGAMPDAFKIHDFAEKHKISSYYAWAIWRQNYDEGLGFEETDSEDEIDSEDG